MQQKFIHAVNKTSIFISKLILSASCHVSCIFFILWERRINQYPSFEWKWWWQKSEQVALCACQLTSWPPRSFYDGYDGTKNQFLQRSVSTVCCLHVHVTAYCAWLHRFPAHEKCWPTLRVPGWAITQQQRFARLHKCALEGAGNGFEIRCVVCAGNPYHVLGICKAMWGTTATNLIVCNAMQVWNPVVWCNEGQMDTTGLTSSPPEVFAAAIHLGWVGGSWLQSSNSGCRSRIHIV